MIPNRLSADELPDVAIESAEFILHRHESLGVLHRGLYLQSIPHDARISQQLFNLAGVVAHHLLNIKIVERATIILAFFQNRNPAQSSLRAFQDQKLEQQAVIMYRNAPFLIMIGDVEITVRPGTTVRDS